MIRATSHLHARSMRRIRRWLDSRRFRLSVVMAGCTLIPFSADAFAAHSDLKPRIIVPVPTSAVIALRKPSAEGSTKPKSRPAAHRNRRKSKKTRRPDIFYRWSAEQLMLGGVNPSQIGKEASGVNGKSVNGSAASNRQKPHGPRDNS
ncbi:hypothetical protein J8I87_07760 [Paraburkholderia sp. LEh10]|uniref:hypothetical protein n=1 Tax=Paraburkholderia sp. LEh10 TaxID=2821353 RepID=UPI001AE614DA|nr:hypothetical protein [Paraburkholderia sp. LEh10]MBP0589615.1 hypothetical protein [Paraburkholderia sp. LEh10]